MRQRAHVVRGYAAAQIYRVGARVYAQTIAVRSLGALRNAEAVLATKALSPTYAKPIVQRMSSCSTPAAPNSAGDSPAAPVPPARTEQLCKARRIITFLNTKIATPKLNHFQYPVRYYQ